MANKPLKPIDLPSKISTRAKIRLRGARTIQALKSYYDAIIAKSSEPLPKRAHPASRKVSHGYRYHPDPADPMYTIMEHKSPLKPPVLMQARGSNLSQDKPGSDQFFTPTKKAPFQRTKKSLMIKTPGGHKQTIHPLQRMSLENKLNPVPDGPVETVTVMLTYRHLRSPKVEGRIDNRRAHGGKNADEKITQIMQDFLLALLNQHLITQTEMQAMLSNLVHHEYTHEIAGHWGVVKENNTGKMRNPAAKESTFPAPAAFNTEMILMERFADFLIFINYHRYKMRLDDPSVEYTFSHGPSFAETKIKDLRTGIEFTQHWDNHMSITEKPSAVLFEQYLAFLKLAWKRELKPHLTPVRFSQDPQSGKPNLSPGFKNNNGNTVR